MTNALSPAWVTLTNRWYKVYYSRQGAKLAKDILFVGAALAANTNMSFRPKGEISMDSGDLSRSFEMTLTFKCSRLKPPTYT